MAHNSLSTKEKARRALESGWQEAEESRVFTGEGWSMGATLPAGTRVRIRFGSTLPLRRGTIVVFRRGEKRVMHRLLAVLGPVCMEKGDGRRFPRLIWRRDILGVFEAIEEEESAKRNQGS